nr:MAG: hypothetical protein AM325_07930 [Candidatus Thorarchaeota archaeon SMTZ1-45]
MLLHLLWDIKVANGFQTVVPSIRNMNDSGYLDCQEFVRLSRSRAELFLTLYSTGVTTRQLQGANSMILMFTSDHCVWCDSLKSMLKDESKALGLEQNIYEVDVEKQYLIAEAYGILVVPTLVAGSYKISGVPSSSDLHSFLLQAVSSGYLKYGRKSVKSVLREVHQIRAIESSKDAIIRTAS